MKMKKIFFLLVSTVALLSTNNLNATNPQSYMVFPKSETYLDVNNLKLEGNTYHLLYPFRIKPNTLYSFVIYEGPTASISYTHHLMDEGISSNPKLQLKTDSITLDNPFTTDLENVAGAVSYVSFKSGEEDQMVQELSFLSTEGLKDKEIMKYCTFFIEGDNFETINFLGPYVDPLPEDQETIYEQAIKEGTYVVSYDHLPTKEDIKKILSANDNVDGDITDKIYIESSMYEEAKELGNYDMVYAVKDSAGNKTTFTIRLKVVDVTAPTILGPDTLVVNMSSSMDDEFFKGLLYVSDNYDENPTLSVKESNFNKEVPGTYKMVFEAKDSSDNKSEYTLYVRVYDNYAPVITASSVIISTSTNEVITIEQISKLVSAQVNCNTDVLKLVYDGYKNHEKEIGEYKCEFIFLEAGKVKQETVKIIVSDTLANQNIQDETKIGLILGGVVVLGVVTGIGITHIIKRKKRFGK